MRTSFKKTLLAGVAGTALAMGWAISPAKAFDSAYWTFNLAIDPCVRISVDLDPASMTTVEVDQSQIGDVTAVSVVKDITVNQPGQNTNFWCFSWNSGPALDAVSQLGGVVSAATAVANNANISTQTDATFVDATQVAHGVVDPGSVTAKSIVKDLKNLTVDSSATAVANNLSISALVPGNLGNSTLVGNIAQTSNMDVSAISVVKDVTLSNYANLGGSFRPVVNSAATAVGNNLSVTVGVHP